MKVLEPADLKKLIETAQNPSISIYIPTHIAGQDTKENPIRLKNAVRKAEKQLKNQDFPVKQTEKLLDPIHELIETHDFWLHQSQGLAVFSCPGNFSYYRLPIKFKETLFIEDRFHIKPLIPLFTRNGRFYILEFNQHQVRLYEATRYHIHELNLPDEVKNISELLKYDELQKLSFGGVPSRSHVRTAGNRAKLHHGQGYEGDPNKYKKDIHRFANELDKAVCKKLRDRRNPLMLAGVEYARAIYSEENTYPNLIKDGIDGNTELFGTDQLHKKAWQVIEPVFNEDLNKTISIYGDLSGTDKVSGNISELLPAAHQGRVRFLFFDNDQYIWGRFNSEDGNVEIHDQREPSDQDMLDLLVTYTLNTRGSVYAIPPEKIPEFNVVAGILRY